MAEAAASTNYVALAGIAATAIVGTTGTLGSWMIARDDRATQQSLAHDERVYEKRSDVYVDALVSARDGTEVIARLLAEQLDAPNAPRPKLPSPEEIRDGRILYARMLTYGSPRAVRAYKRLSDLAAQVNSPFLTRAERSEAADVYGPAVEAFRQIVQAELA